ncbi:uncharacterized protein ASCRUDRAFT_6197 [Ascoidea rubescens DSM 1968]|uniref:Uncharacterized protein n=1 Tax=Ascoidea rubescens DSM 1968 TaxID=1344418 RepID=A0A1D2VRX5_9ASCO|nr:hypothetical protein ASCRUDRAFT_6197 [Ascoidea rubescens DSM 1968]ODV64364.1 hypothetical protein ASCRUDRAFT_6197 [Ascoidea rubescens DSM 1968]
MKGLRTGSFARTKVCYKLQQNKSSSLTLGGFRLRLRPYAHIFRSYSSSLQSKQPQNTPIPSTDSRKTSSELFDLWSPLLLKSLDSLLIDDLLSIRKSNSIIISDINGFLAKLNQNLKLLKQIENLDITSNSIDGKHNLLIIYEKLFFILRLISSIYSSIDSSTKSQIQNNSQSTNYNLINLIVLNYAEKSINFYLKHHSLDKDNHNQYLTSLHSILSISTDLISNSNSFINVSILQNHLNTIIENLASMQNVSNNFDFLVLNFEKLRISLLCDYYKNLNQYNLLINHFWHSYNYLNSNYSNLLSNDTFYILNSILKLNQIIDYSLIKNDSLTVLQLLNLLHSKNSLNDYSSMHQYSLIKILNYSLIYDYYQILKFLIIHDFKLIQSQNKEILTKMLLLLAKNNDSILLQKISELIPKEKLKKNLKDLNFSKFYNISYYLQANLSFSSFIDPNFFITNSFITNENKTSVFTIEDFNPTDSMHFKSLIYDNILNLKQNFQKIDELIQSGQTINSNDIEFLNIYYNLTSKRIDNRIMITDYDNDLNYVLNSQIKDIIKQNSLKNKIKTGIKDFKYNGPSSKSELEAFRRPRVYNEFYTQYIINEILPLLNTKHAKFLFLYNLLQSCVVSSSFNQVLTCWYLNIPHNEQIFGNKDNLSSYISLILKSMGKEIEYYWNDLLISNEFFKLIKKRNQKSNGGKVEIAIYYKLINFSISVFQNSMKVDEKGDSDKADVSFRSILFYLTSYFEDYCYNDENRSIDLKIKYLINKLHAFLLKNRNLVIFVDILRTLVRDNQRVHEKSLDKNKFPSYELRSICLNEKADFDLLDKIIIINEDIIDE